MPYALVTGPTAGIGAAFARLLAREGYDLVLVARDEARLAAMATELQTSVRAEVETLAADLSTADGIHRTEARLRDETRPIEVLVNNAGFSLRAAFLSSGIDDEQRLLDVLVTAPMRFTHAVLPSMVARGRGYVINVGSTAAFIPANSYSAAKSYLTVFSESLSEQLRGTGVKVTVVAPGYTHTEFHERAGMDMAAVPELFWLDPADVALQAWVDVRRGRPLSVPSWQYRTLAFLARYGPRPVVRRVATRRPGPQLRPR